MTHPEELTDGLIIRRLCFVALRMSRKHKRVEPIPSREDCLWRDMITCGCLIRLESLAAEITETQPLYSLEIPVLNKTNHARELYEQLGRTSTHPTGLRDGEPSGFERIKGSGYFSSRTCRVRPGRTFFLHSPARPRHCLSSVGHAVRMPLPSSVRIRLLFGFWQRHRAGADPMRVEPA